MTYIVAATGASAWLLLIGAAIAGIAFGMMLNTTINGRKKQEVARAASVGADERAAAPVEREQRELERRGRGRRARSKTAAVPDAVSRQMSALHGT